MWYNQRELYTSILSNKLNNSEQFLLIDNKENNCWTYKTVQEVTLNCQKTPTTASCGGDKGRHLFLCHFYCFFWNYVIVSFDQKTRCISTNNKLISTLFICIDTTI